MDNKNNSNNSVFNVMEFIDQALDAYIEKDLKEACEKTGDQTAMALMDLFIEYGIRGRKLVELLHKMQMICDITKVVEKEDEDDG